DPGRAPARVLRPHRGRDARRLGRARRRVPARAGRDMRPSRIAIAFVVAVAIAIAGGVYLTRADGPPGGPGAFAVGVVRLIVENRYGEAWADLHPIDQLVAPKGEYVGCENRTRFSAKFVRATPGPVTDEAVGLGNGRFVRSKAVEVRVTLKEEDLEPFV